MAIACIKRFDAPAVRLNNAPRGSKAESIAARLGGVIRLKGVLAHLRRQSWASVFRINSSTAGVLAPAFGRLGVHRKFQCPGAVLGEVLHGLH